LEAAWQHGAVRGRDALTAFIETSLEQLGHAGLPFALAAFDDPGQLPELDELCEAFTNNHVANRASRAQGRALLTAIEKIFIGTAESPGAEIRFAHFAPVFGASLRRLKVSRAVAGRMFLFNHLRAVLAAAVRLNIVGPMEAQRMQHHLSVNVENILKKCEDLPVDEVAQTAPLLDLWQGAHDRLYSRLFQS
jgi:urease accessory protein